MTKVFRWLTLTAVVALAAGVAAWAWHALTKPTTLTIAVGPANSEDAQLAVAWARVLSAEAARVRLTVVPTSGPIEAHAVLGSKVGSMIASIHNTSTPAELDAIRDEIDQIVDRVAAEASTGGIDEQRLAALSLAINHIDRTLADQRAILLQRATSGAHI